jgi:hypothetical protein
MDTEHDTIYKALQLVQQQYFSGEQIFPVWESIHAVIVGGLFAVYANLSPSHLFLRVLTCILAVIFSATWSGIINRAALYSFARMSRIKDLEARLNCAYPNIFNSQQYTKAHVENEEQCWSTLDTWYIRKIVPALLLTIWIALLIITIFCPHLLICLDHVVR